MLVITIRTDKQEAELGLYGNGGQLDYLSWQAHRQLAETIHSKIHTLLKKHDKDWHDIQGIIYYKGPGSFTGLRIGASVANALAAGLDCQIVGTNSEEWQQQGLQQLHKSRRIEFVTPEYGAGVHITKPKH